MIKSAPGQPVPVVSYQDSSGHDRTILFSNSLGADHTMWASQVSALRNEVNIVRYDSRGHGRTPASPGEYSVESWNERTSQVRQNGLSGLLEGTEQRCSQPTFEPTTPPQVESILRIFAATSVDGYTGSRAAVRDADFRSDPPRSRCRLW